MKSIGITSTCALALLLAIAAPVWAQEQHEQEQKEKPAMHEEKQAKPEKQVKPEKSAKPAAKAEKPARQEEKQAVKQEKPANREVKSPKENEKSARAAEKKARPAKESNGEKKNDMRPSAQTQPGRNGVQARGGRIPDDRYRAKFGEQHRFHVSQNDYARNHRFKYGGYSFGFVGVWPSDWLYTQDVYVIEIDGVYYLCNPMFPGVNLEISVIM